MWVGGVGWRLIPLDLGFRPCRPTALVKRVRFCHSGSSHFVTFCRGVFGRGIDRWGRSLKHLVTSLADLDAYGVAFVSLRDNLDLSTPSGRLMMQLLGAMAEFERALIQERVKAGLRNARAKGKRLGRPQAVVSESKINSLRASGASWREIAKQLGVGIGTVHRASQRRSKNLCGGIPEIEPEAIHV